MAVEKGIVLDFRPKIDFERGEKVWNVSGRNGQ
jgi:hypothetical protein